MGTRVAFSKAMNILFENMGRKVLYQGVGEEQGKEVLVVYRMPYTTFDAEESFVASPTNLFEVRLVEVPSPKAGDMIVLDEKTFVVQGTPERDQHGLYWKLNTVEKE